MFIDFLDYNYNTEEVDKHLINLDEILLVNEATGVYRIRNDRKNKVQDWYSIVVYHKGHTDPWKFYYPDKQTQHKYYMELRKALKECGKLLEHEKDPLITDISEKEDWTEQYLGNKNV